MKKLKLLLGLILLVCFIFAGCANTRDPNPITMKSNTDNEMGCEEIIAEYIANTGAANQKIAKNKKDDERDIVVGALIWPGLADFKNADGIEGNAYLDRNLYLKALGEMKKCDLGKLPEQPARYK